MQAPPTRPAAKLSRWNAPGLFRWPVRAGFVARAVTYGVVGGLAFTLALGAGTDGTAPNQQGALELIARNPAGRVALVLLSAGLLAYALWKLTQGVFGAAPREAAVES
jgi:Domain of Unknown Function (DUF1206)